MEKEIVNKVAQSPLVTIDLEELYDTGEKVLYDLKDNLYEGIILKEKDFRQFLKTNDWSTYSKKHVAIHCSVDAIIPSWAYMLLASYLEPHVKSLVYGDLAVLENRLIINAIQKMDLSKFTDKKVVIKGCGKIDVPTWAYVELTSLLKPIVTSIMYGEPCSTVPIYKRPKKKAENP